MRQPLHLFSLIYAALVPLCLGLAMAQDPPLIRKLSAKQLPNAIEVPGGLISGGLPESEQAFQELKQLGVKTIISVDGVKPDVQMAQRYGMRYVHIPHGYDGISESTLGKLTKAVSELPGPIYIHCHHGKHRSPTAAAAVCIARGSIELNQALRILELAGTNPSYKGLFQTVRTAKRIEPDELAKLQVDFPSVCDVSPLVDSMVALDDTFSKLNKWAQAGWKSKPDPSGPSMDAAHEAVLLREHFEEMQRLEELSKYPVEFARILKESEQAAVFIESMLNPISGEIRLKPIHRKALDVNWTTIRSNCTSCHQQFRDNL
jgi:protein tyrosine phosphatase (PTP) superfamily phosphohydrolase (DUF442 family)